MVSELVWLGVALFLAPALGEFAKVRAKGDKGFLWISAGGAMYLLAAAFEIPFFNLADTLAYGTQIFSVIGLIATLIGSILVLLNVFK